jgi:hypothetical protein
MKGKLDHRNSKAKAKPIKKVKPLQQKQGDLF